MRRRNLNFQRVVHAFTMAALTLICVVGIAKGTPNEEAEPENWIKSGAYMKSEGLQITLKVTTNRLIFGETLNVVCEIWNSNKMTKEIYMPGLAVIESYEIEPFNRSLKTDEAGPLVNARLRRGSREFDYFSLAPHECFSRSMAVCPQYYGALVLRAYYDHHPDVSQGSTTNRCGPLRVAVERNGSIEYLSELLHADSDPSRRVQAARRLGLLQDDAAIPALVFAVRSDADTFVRCVSITALQATLGLPVDVLPNMNGPHEKIDEWISGKTNAIVTQAEQRIKHR